VKSVYSVVDAEIEGQLVNHILPLRAAQHGRRLDAACCDGAAEAAPSVRYIRPPSRPTALCGRAGRPRYQQGARVACLSILVITIVAGCAAKPAPPVALPADPSARLAAVQAQESRVRSLRARFSSVTRLPGGEREADGVLLVAKPDRFRLRLMLPFGFTVFDYLNVGDQTWMALPLADAAQRNRMGEFAPFSREDLGQAFLRGAYAFPGQCDAAQAAAGDVVVVTCREGGAVRRTLHIGGTGIVEETSYEGGAARLVIRYADYRDAGGVSVPFRITMDYPQRQQSVDITIDRYEVNPVLSDDLFRPLPDSVEQHSSVLIPPPAAREALDGLS